MLGTMQTMTGCKLTLLMILRKQPRKRCVEYCQSTRHLYFPQQLAVSIKVMDDFNNQNYLDIDYTDGPIAYSTTAQPVLPSRISDKLDVKLQNREPLDEDLQMELDYEAAVLSLDNHLQM